MDSAGIQIPYWLVIIYTIIGWFIAPYLAYKFGLRRYKKETEIEHEMEKDLLRKEIESQHKTDVDLMKREYIMELVQRRLNAYNKIYNLIQDLLSIYIFSDNLLSDKEEKNKYWQELFNKTIKINKLQLFSSNEVQSRIQLLLKCMQERAEGQIQSDKFHELLLKITDQMRKEIQSGTIESQWAPLDEKS